MIERKWADREAISGKPLLITDILDDVERSLSGLALMVLSDTYKVPFIGKNFIPRVQFELMDLVNAEKLFKFNGILDENNIAEFANLIVTHEKIITFWLNSLNEDASKSLREFLEKQLALSQNN